MKDILETTTACVIYLILLAGIVCFLWAVLSPLYQRTKHIVQIETEQKGTPLYAQDDRAVAKKAFWMMFLELLSKGIKYGLISLAVSFMTPFATLVFLFLIWQRWQKWKIVPKVDPDAWVGPFFSSIYCGLAALLVGGVGFGSIYLIYGSV